MPHFVRNAVLRCCTLLHVVLDLMDPMIHVDQLSVSVSTWTEEPSSDDDFLGDFYIPFFNASDVYSINNCTHGQTFEYLIFVFVVVVFLSQAIVFFDPFALTCGIPSTYFPSTPGIFFFFSPDPS